MLNETIDQLLYYNEPYEAEFKIVRSNDKAIRSIYSKAELIKDADNEKVFVIGIIQDITELLQSQEDLKQSYVFNETLLKTIPFGMDIVDETGTVLFQSDAIKRVFGNIETGKKCWDLYRDDKTQCVNCPLNSGIVIGETKIYETGGVIGSRAFEISHPVCCTREGKQCSKFFRISPIARKTKLS